VEHHTKNESKKYYKRIQDVTQEFKPRVNARRDANGKILTEKRTFRKEGRRRPYLEANGSRGKNEWRGDKEKDTVAVERLRTRDRLRGRPRQVQRHRD